MITDLLVTVLTIATWVIIAWIILSYVVNFGRVPGDHPVSQLYRFLARTIDPVLAPIRRAIPPLRLGGMNLDLSPLILLFGIQILIALLR
jgi:YggT family protein